jgi:hypothetical protein
MCLKKTVDVGHGRISLYFHIRSVYRLQIKEHAQWTHVCVERKKATIKTTKQLERNVFTLRISVF